MTEYYSVVTDVGAARITNAALLGQKVDVTHFAVGDGGGAPGPGMTTLKNEVWRGSVAGYEADGASPNLIRVRGLLPSSVGGFTIRELGVFDADDNLIAVGNVPDTPKLTLAEGVSSEMELTLELLVSNAEVLQCSVDPTVIIATKAEVRELAETTQAAVEGLLKQDYHPSMGANLNFRAPVNTQNKNAYTSGGALDWWALDPNGGGVELSVQDGFVRLTQTNVDGGTFSQSMLQEITDAYIYSGQTVTLTACHRGAQASKMLWSVSDNGVQTIVGKTDLPASEDWRVTSATVKLPEISQASGTLHMFFYADMTGKLGHTDYLWVKPELGDHFTGFYPEPPSDARAKVVLRNCNGYLATATPPREYALPLAAGFADNGGGGASVYWKNQMGEVHAVASVSNIANVPGGVLTLATLPAGFRPGRTLIFCGSHMDNTGVRVGGTSLNVNPDGGIVYCDSTPIGANGIIWGHVCFVAAN